MYLDTNPVIRLFYLSDQFEGVYQEYNIAKVVDWNLYGSIEISVSCVWEIRPF